MSSQPSTSIYSPDTVKGIAESMGIKQLPESVASALASEVDYRVNQVVQEAAKFMKHAKRTELLPEDINHALSSLCVEPIYGFTQPVHPSFRRAGPSSNEVYFVDDEEVDLEKLLREPLPPAPQPMEWTVHWLAVEGVQPIIPQNPTPEEAKLDLMDRQLLNEPAALTSPVERGDGAKGAGVAGPSVILPGNALPDGKGSGQVEVKLRVKHILSKELQEYYERVKQALDGKADATAQGTALASLAKDPGLHQLLPYFVQFVTDRITTGAKDLGVISMMLETIRALLNNPYFLIEHYLEQLTPAILSCTVTKRLGTSPLEGHWEVRRTAARLAASLVPRFGQAYHTLQPRLVKTYLRGWLDAARPLTTQYGALAGLQALGPEVVRAKVLPSVRAYGEVVGGQLGTEDGTRRMEAEKVLGLLVETVASVGSSITTPKNSGDGDGDESMEDPTAELDEGYGTVVSRALQEKYPSPALWRTLVHALTL